MGQPHPALTRSFAALSYLFVAGASLAFGYLLGSQLGADRTTASLLLPTDDTEPIIEVHAEGGDEDDDEDEEDLADGDLSAIKPQHAERCKLVLVVRADLKMTSGKIAAHHATLACYKALMKANPNLVQHWEITGQAKIALRGSSEEELLELEAVAKSLNICARSILDAGRTQIAAGSRTVLGIGPAPVDLVDQVTGHLRLL